MNGFGNFMVLLYLILLIAEALAFLFALIIRQYVIAMALVAGLNQRFLFVLVMLYSRMIYIHTTIFYLGLLY